MSKILRIGVFIPQFKWERMNLHSVNPKDHGIELVSVEIGADLSSFDAIIHKFTYQLVDGHAEDVYKIHEYAKNRKNFVVIEPIDHIGIFVDRMVLQNFINMNPLPIFAEYVNGYLFDENFTLEAHNLRYPLLIKSVAACGTDASHLIQVIQSEEQLNEVPRSTNFMVFPFVEHHGVVFKCYSLGEHTVMRSSKSLVLHQAERVQFDSQKPLPEGIAGNEVGKDLVNSIEPSLEEIRQISSSLRLATSVNLIGFDILRRESDGKLCLIDFNYFPCFRGIDDIPGKLAGFIKSKIL